MKNRLGIAVKLATSLVLICAILVTSLYDAEGLWAAHQEPTPQYQARESDHQEEYPLMKPSREKRREWIEKYNKAPKAHIDEQVKRKLALAPTGSLSLLSHLQYTPSERNQGSCGNCWAWAGTGVMEIALSVQRSIKDRLSIQYLNSNFNGGSGVDWACCGGWLSDIASFYSSTGKAIPWSNTNASWQDGSRGCGSSTSVPGANISTTPYYPITSIATQTITTHGVTQNTAIANIKNVLNQNKAVWFAYFLPTTADWSNFSTFWSTQSESTIWDPDFSCGHAWDAGGAGHAVLCVGYNDDDPNNRYWIMVNSWGTAGGNRPNGIFRLAMDMNYGCQDGDGDYMFYWQTLNIAYGNTPGDTGQKLIGADDATIAMGASNGYLCLSRFSCSQTGTVTQFKLKASSPGNVKVAIYADNAGEPGSLLNSVNTSTAVIAGWNTITFPATSLTSGTYYWLAFNSDAPIVGTLDPGTGYSRYAAATYSSFTFPNPPTSLSGWSRSLLIAGWGTTTPPSPPSPPSLLSPGTAITFRWGTATGATSYWLQVNTQSNFGGTNIYNAEVGNVTTQEVSGFSLGTTYYWRVRAGNSAGWGNWSTTRSVQTADIP